MSGQIKQKVVEKKDVSLTEKEKDIVDKIGIENADYCVASVLNNRFPDKEIIYYEDETAFEIGGQKMELQYNIIQNDKDLDPYSWISENVSIIEGLFEFSDE